MYDLANLNTEVLPAGFCGGSKPYWTLIFSGSVAQLVAKA